METHSSRRQGFLPGTGAHGEDVLRLARAGCIDCGILKVRYLEEVRPSVLNKHEWHDQTLELWIEMIAAPGSSMPKAAK